MASKMLGRVPCVEPNCGFPSAHIKVNIDTEGKRPYRHCPECGAQYFPRTALQVTHMTATMRPEGEPAPNNSSEAEGGTAAAPGEEAPHQAAPEQRYKTVFGVKVPV
jgi:hypothetical protein